MKTKLIQTIKTRKTSPALAFFLSLIIPGLGQLYNGDFLRGALFVILRIFIVLIAAATAAGKPGPASFAALVISFFLATIASPLESLVFSIKLDTIKLKRYNTLLFYFFFAVTSTALTLASVIVLTSFFTIAEITGENNRPLVNSGDIVLINMYIPNGYRKGELILYNKTSAGRIAALEKERVAYKNGLLSVNGRVLPLGRIKDGYMGRISDTYDGTILSEKNGNLLYPIYYDKEAGEKDIHISITVPDNSVAIAGDNRLKKDIIETTPLSSINGRIEGILFSGRLKKILLPSFIE